MQYIDTYLLCVEYMIHVCIHCYTLHNAWIHNTACENAEEEQWEFPQSAPRHLEGYTLCSPSLSAHFKVGGLQNK